MKVITRLPFDKERCLERRESHKELQEWLVIGFFVLLVLWLLFEWFYQSGQLHALRSIG